ncbi:MAG: toxin-antitoxin system HicB family antitoxin [Anaerolineae bacterium]|nr:toxin-antitoxin system HicB family antitoxin [Anaerolineae bacterium]
MKTIELLLADDLYERAKTLAERDHVSLNQFIMLALAEKVSAMLTFDVVATRAKRASRQKFLEAMAQVPDMDPDEPDKL